MERGWVLQKLDEISKRLDALESKPKSSPRLGHNRCDEEGDKEYANHCWHQSNKNLGRQKCCRCEKTWSV